MLPQNPSLLQTISYRGSSFCQWLKEKVSFNVFYH
jgi:hypothetical protein